jgi:hypothetical protein
VHDHHHQQIRVHFLDRPLLDTPPPHRQLITITPLPACTAANTLTFSFLWQPLSLKSTSWHPVDAYLTVRDKKPQPARTANKSSFHCCSMPPRSTARSSPTVAQRPLRCIAAASFSLLPTATCSSVSVAAAVELSTLPPPIPPGIQPLEVCDEQRIISATITSMTSRRGPEKSICPSEVARFLFPVNWRLHMEMVRNVAWTLAGEGKLVVTQVWERFCFKFCFLWLIIVIASHFVATMQRGHEVAPGARGAIRLRMAKC